MVFEFGGLAVLLLGADVPLLLLYLAQGQFIQQLLVLVVGILELEVGFLQPGLRKRYFLIRD